MSERERKINEFHLQVSSMNLQKESLTIDPNAQTSSPEVRDERNPTTEVEQTEKDLPTNKEVIDVIEEYRVQFNNQLRSQLRSQMIEIERSNIWKLR